MVSSDRIVVYVDSDLEELVPRFLENRRRDVNDLKQSCIRRDAAQLKAIGHSMKGTGGGYGFDDISKIGARIEEAAKASEYDAVDISIKQLEDYLERVDVLFR